DQCRSEAFPSDHNWRLAARRRVVRRGVAGGHRWRCRRHNGRLADVEAVTQRTSPMLDEAGLLTLLA
ncbi:MAG: hypothetical protein WKF96_21995, partial [Solirubrobacteraceae bacterium]